MGGRSNSHNAEVGYSRLFINIGKVDGINPANLMGFVNENVPGKVRIGKIDLLKNFSFFEVPQEDANKVLKSFKGLFIDDRKLIVELSQESQGSSNKERFSKKRSRPFRK